MKKVVVQVGNILLGSANRNIPIQTMCNTPTSDVEASYLQCRQLYESGADMVRLAVQGEREVSAFEQVTNRLRRAGIAVPLIADVHFSYRIALKVAPVADKVRINPGNFAKDHRMAREQFSALTEICKKYGTSIRIGVNHGSLGERIVERFGNSPEGMKEAAKEWISMAEADGFDQIVISLKSSNTKVMVEAYRSLYADMVSKGVVYPLHLGVTEAGNGDMGRIKSAIGISSLLKEGVGDTIRVSLTENPINEISVAQHILHFSGHKPELPPIVPSDRQKIIHRHYEAENYEAFIINASCELGPLLMDGVIDDVVLSAKVDGEELTSDKISNFRDELLQSSRRKFSKPEYIACPGCGRTLFDLENTFNEVKRRTSHLKGYVIAVMGCVVNGPGEMADADYGYVGEGRGKVSLYRGKHPVIKGVSEREAVDRLLEIILQDARNRDDHPRNG